MQPSRELYEFVKVEEGKRLKAYRCPAGYWTIGYGHTSAAGAPVVSPGMVITLEQANEILWRDLLKVAMAVDRLLKVPVTQYQYDALVSFGFNLGLTRLKGSTLLKMVNQKRFDEVPAQFMRWVYANDPRTGKKVQLKGLVKRRRAEAEIWRGLKWGGEVNITEKLVEEVRKEAPVRLDPVEPPAKPITKSREALGAISGLFVVFSWIYGEWQALLKDHTDLATTIVSNPRLLIPLLIVALLGSILYWRYQRLKEGT
jgi:GH24 family phage-related lysozyme (muramidase)